MKKEQKNSGECSNCFKLVEKLHANQPAAGVHTMKSLVSIIPMLP